MKKILVFLIFCILMVSGNYCKKITERETLDNPALNPKQFKAFRIELAGKNYLECKERIYIETLTHSTDILLDNALPPAELLKLKNRFIELRKDKMRDFFVLNYDEILSRRPFGTGILLKMKIMLKVAAIGDFLTQSGFSDLNYPALLAASEEILVSDTETRQMLTTPDDYLSAFKGKTFAVLTESNGTSLNSRVLKTLLIRMNNVLSRIGLNPVSQDIIDAALGTGVTLKARTTNLIADYFIVFGESTVLKRGALGYFMFSSLIQLKLYNNRLRQIGTANDQIEKIILNREGYTEEILRLLKDRTFPALLKSASSRYNPGVRYKIIFKNTMDKNFTEQFIANLKPRQIILVNSVIEIDRIVTEVSFQGSISEIRNIILLGIDNDEYKNKLYLSDLQKNMIEVTFKGVRVN